MRRWRLSAMAVVILCVWLLLSGLGAAEIWRRTRLPPDDDDAPTPSVRPSPSAPAASPSATSTQPAAPPSPAASAQPATSAPPAVLPSAVPGRCRRTHGADPKYTTDDRGYTCTYASVDAATGCCSTWVPRYSCDGCGGGCCASYARCVACCMGRTGAAFASCSGSCRTSARLQFCWAKIAATSPSAAPGTKMLDLASQPLSERPPRQKQP